MNIILLEHDEIVANTVNLRDRRAEHIGRVLKSRPGDLLRAGIIDGPMGSARVLATSRREVTLQLDCHQDPPTKAATALILALPRPIMLKRVLAQAAAMGVDRIMLTNARRVEKSFFNSSLLAPAGIRTALLQGLEQAGDTRLPTVSVHTRFRPFIEDELPSPHPAGPLRLLAHPEKAPAEATDSGPRRHTTNRQQNPPAGAPPSGTAKALVSGHKGPQVTAGETAMDDQGQISYLPPSAPAQSPLSQVPRDCLRDLAQRRLLAIGPEGGWVDFEINCFQDQGFIPFSWGARILRVDTAVPVLLALAEAR
ncbi:16S rRNA (uracil(1498)-N(3))-methyltransferase [Desulfurivibrio dismutans]|uniref:16S rRNA (uracil(1498)-N(3))-methyltransferase n=1 Tax=Desulfurivibrio dismutans TaxID=1398908 RepID=UPI0023DC7110|nr:RsmE family RNA methyltransferase [Desulfurivibrio alkaliphilus]MDF1614775.1 RsmE family RNA methyltransferase [Desulfurivibrio alkaliphilus]